MDFMHLLSIAGDVATALLAILGGLKVLARYSKTEADDKILAAIEAPIKAALSFLSRK
jgi:hypothetical protein